MGPVIKIVLADNHRLFIEGLQNLLSDESDIEILDFAFDGKELLGLLNLVQPDVILLDINMPGIDGFETAKRIKKISSHVRIILLTSYDDELFLKKAKDIGVNGYLLKDCGKEDLVDCIRAVHTDDKMFYLQPEMTKSVPSDFDRNFLNKYRITDREIEIVELLKDGLTNYQIADKLSISIHTVETHRKNVMHKLGVNNLASLIKHFNDNRS
ncbi:MAG TPA: response regulator transcription factor [Chitinophagaceae bacterium]